MTNYAHRAILKRYEQVRQARISIEARIQEQRDELLATQADLEVFQAEEDSLYLALQAFEGER